MLKGLHLTPLMLQFPHHLLVLLSITEKRVKTTVKEELERKKVIYRFYSVRIILASDISGSWFGTGMNLWPLEMLIFPDQKVRCGSR